MNSSRRTFLTTFLTIPLFIACRDHKSTLAPSLNKPATKFDLSRWKLQIPAPQQITNLSGYASKYFYLNSLNQMCFWVDCSETGHTRNSDYVRSELRHLANWSVNDDAPKTLKATLKVHSKANPDKVTVLQIHGITNSGGNAPPLLRIALNNGSLYAFIKTNNSGDDTDSIILASNVAAQEFSCAITVHNGRLLVSANGIKKIDRDISFWQYANYFKAGCYPQSHSGTVTVMFSHLSAKANSTQSQ